jgi:acyl-CoA dehydrogenase
MGLRRTWIGKFGVMPALESTVDMYDLRMSEGVRPLYEQVKTFIAEEVAPMSEKFFELGANRADRWSYAPGQLELLEEVKDKAKANGLWNFFLPDAETGEGLSNLDYAYIAIELGKNPLASESMNCAAPDTGNMEVLERVGTEAQKREWLDPLLRGEIRSAYAMTEPDVASSDAKNIACKAERDGDEWLINGEKYYISGAGDPRCKIMITMVQTSEEGPAHMRQSQILVPIDTPGVQILGPMHVFGKDDAPHGHMHIKFDNVRVPYENVLLGEGRGFEISQVRLGPGRIHHCMRSIGQAEKALQMMVSRGLTRDAFGKPLAKLGGNTETIAKARIEIESMRRMVLTAAKAMDELGNSEARVWVSAVKAMVPIRVCEIIDQAIQMHGGTGVSQWTPLADMYASQRTLRLADGPDEVHWMVVGRSEVNKGEDAARDYDPKQKFLDAQESGEVEMKDGAFSGPA